MMMKYETWEPAVGQVPPDGCEFIMNQFTSDAIWLVWADSGNRAINETDRGLFQFRIPAPIKESPMVIKYFTFETRPEADKEYKTLADVPEGVRCVTKLEGSEGELIRVRKGGRGCNTCGDGLLQAVMYYPIIQFLDPLPAPQLPATMAEAEECRVYKTATHGMMFKYYGIAWCVSDGKFMQTHCGDLRRWDVDITAATNTYAVPCSLEVKC